MRENNEKDTIRVVGRGHGRSYRDWRKERSNTIIYSLNFLKWSICFSNL